MPQAVACAYVAIAVELHIQLVEDGVHQLARRLPEDAIGWFELFAFANALEWKDRTGHRLAETYPALAAHLDLQDAFAGRFVVHDFDVPQLKPRRLIGPQPGVAHEQNIIVKGLADFTPARLGRVLRPLARRFVEHLVFLGREPGAMLDLAGRLVGRRDRKSK